MKKVLILEDSDNLREAMHNYLKLYDYDTHSCSTIQDARDLVKKLEPDLAVLDINLPDGNGFFFAKEELIDRGIPFLFLSSRFEESDKVLGFEIGAEDYITKPFSLKEMVLRINGILERKKDIGNSEDVIRSFLMGKEKIRFNEKKHLLSVNENRLTLTPTEWGIMSCLIGHNEAILSREQIKKSIWDISDKMSDKTLDSHIKNIRRKLDNSDWIETVRGFGFRFNGIDCGR